MKMLIAFMMTGALLAACGSKSKTTTTTPDNTTGTTETQPTDGTGGSTYGGSAATPTPAAGTDVCAGGM